MQQRILIIDYTTHHPALVKSLCALFGEHQLSLVITASFKRKFGDNVDISLHKLLVKPKKIAESEWIAQLQPLVAAQDIVLFSTGVKSPLLAKSLALQTTAKKIIFVHNSHYFAEKFPLKASEYRRIVEPESSRIKSMLHFTSEKTALTRKKIRHTLQGCRFEKIAPMVDFFCFGNEHMSRHFAAFSGHGNVVTLPVNTQINGLPKPQRAGALRIAILGNITPDRRNYLETIELLGAAQFNAPVELHILGSCRDKEYGEQLNAAIANSSNRNLRVVFDIERGFIPNAELIDALQSIDVLLSPIKLDFAFHLHRERYGLTKISGAESDCVAFNRPVLLPRNYLFSERVRPFVVSYGDDGELATAINELTDPVKLDALYQRMAARPISAANREMRDEFLAQVTLPQTAE